METTRQLLQKSPLQWIMEEIDGHKDKEKPYELTCWEQSNVDMDLSVKARCKQITSTFQLPHSG